MSNSLLLTVIFGGWIILLALLVWVCLLQRKLRPGSLRSAMLILCLITAIPVYSRTHDLGMPLLVVLMACIGVAIGAVGNRRWDKAHREGRK